MVCEVIFLKFWKAGVLFGLGGCAYVILEFLWRGRSDGSMFFLGGLCFCLVGPLPRRFPRLPLAIQVILGAGIVTALELAAGLLWNRDYRIWDYRGLPFQFRGQISLIYSLLWMPVSLCAMMIYEKAERRIEKNTAG